MDISVYNAARYKRLAKVSYVVQLLLGIVIIVLTVFRDQIDDNTCEVCSCPMLSNSSAVGEDAVSSTGIFVTALLLTTLASLSAFFSPAQRWRELRAAAESLIPDVCGGQRSNGHSKRTALA